MWAVAAWELNVLPGLTSMCGNQKAVPALAPEAAASLTSGARPHSPIMQELPQAREMCALLTGHYVVTGDTAVQGHQQAGTNTLFCPREQAEA